MKDSKKTEVITFRTDKETKEKLENIATKRKWSISQLSEEIINNFVNAKDDTIKILEIFKDEEKITLYSKITKTEQELVFNISEELNCEWDDAIRFTIQYTGITWPFE